MHAHTQMYTHSYMYTQSYPSPSVYVYFVFMGYLHTHLCVYVCVHVGIYVCEFHYMRTCVASCHGDTWFFSVTITMMSPGTGCTQITQQMFPKMEFRSLRSVTTQLLLARGFHTCKSPVPPSHGTYCHQPQTYPTSTLNLPFLDPNFAPAGRRTCRIHLQLRGRWRCHGSSGSSDAKCLRLHCSFVNFVLRFALLYHTAVYYTKVSSFLLSCCISLYHVKLYHVMLYCIVLC